MSEQYLSPIIKMPVYAFIAKLVCQKFGSSNPPAQKN
jgi:hypothetical protein